MSTSVHRFLSRREKRKEDHHNAHSSTKQQQQQRASSKPPEHFPDIFILDVAGHKNDKDEERKVKGILERLRHYGIDNIIEANVEYALKHGSAPDDGGDTEAAFRLLMLLEDTYEGLVKPYTPSTKMLGAVNREGVTCYLDALLFAMFVRLDSFEAMLYDSFSDRKRRKLSGMLRLWVNLLRSGRLVTTDVTMQLQEALADCGWSDAARLRQQDPSEAFTFITGQLELPLLTLKMDLYHTGKEDPQDDHKFVNERLLEVAIPSLPPEGNDVITLEDCLEHYFNNRIEVKRHLENQRRNTLKSVTQLEDNAEKLQGLHIEVAEIDGTPRSDSPMVHSPMVEAVSVLDGEPSESPLQAKGPVEKLRPTAGRKRTDSIFSQRKLELNRSTSADGTAEESTEVKPRKMSTRTEVLMPAWQFFKLLPWYTDNMPTSDAQVAAHFARKRPVLGICLKRYSYTLTGQATRLDTFIDIPLEIAVPDFVSDENMDEEGPLVGNFRLLLQSVVCHRGVSVNSGHYITLCRSSASGTQRATQKQDHTSNDGSDSEDDAHDLWMRFDDLAKPRVTYVDIREALKQEMPYLLFYQVQPIDEDGNSIHDLPSYAEATSRSQSEPTPSEKQHPLFSPSGESGSELALTDSNANGEIKNNIETTDFAPRSARASIDASSVLEAPRGRSSLSLGDERERRKSITFDESALSSTGSVKTDGSAPTTPEEKNSNLLSVPYRLGSRRSSNKSKGSTSRSRPTSLGRGETDTSPRFSLNMSKLTLRMSKDQPPAAAAATNGPTAAHSEGATTGPADEAQAQQQSNRSARNSEETNRAMPLPTTQNGSREGLNAVKPPKYKEREKPAKVSKSHKHKGHRSAEDRECAVM